tara:strand:- start:18 stop:1181 length:1164 start_codon:yes stop_codon:yes gene_type:complete
MIGRLVQVLDLQLRSGRAKVASLAELLTTVARCFDQGNESVHFFSSKKLAEEAGRVGGRRATLPARMISLISVAIAIASSSAAPPLWRRALASIRNRPPTSKVEESCAVAEEEPAPACEIADLLWDRDLDWLSFMTQYAARARPVMLRNFTRASDGFNWPKRVWDGDDFAALANGSAGGHLPPIETRGEGTDAGLESASFSFPRMHVEHPLLEPFPTPRAFQGCDSSHRLAAGTEGGGLDFHQHGAVYHALMFGEKQWLLADANTNGGLSPRRETRLGTGGRSAQEIADGITEPESLAGLHRWLLDPESEAAIGEEVLRCTQRAGDVLYLPERWFHATIHSSPQTLGFATFCGSGNRWGKAMTQTIRDRREGVEHERAFHDRWGTGH